MNEQYCFEAAYFGALFLVLVSLRYLTITDVPPPEENINKRIRKRGKRHLVVPKDRYAKMSKLGAIRERDPTCREIHAARTNRAPALAGHPDYALSPGHTIAWKACVVYSVCARVFVLVELFVPCDARRVAAENDPENRRKSRVDSAYVLSIKDLNGDEYTTATSFVLGYWMNIAPLTYNLGKWVFPHQFNPDPGMVCGAGINVHRIQQDCMVWEFMLT